jgi:DNA polymerase (family 10)
MVTKKLLFVALLTLCMGSIEHNIKLCSRARAMGMMLSAAQGVIKEGKVIASRTEEEIFKALELEYIRPEDRE